MKTFDKKDVFSWANCEEAKQYIGKQGYFANTMTQLRDSINKNEVYILCKIFEDVGNCFYTTESSYSIGFDFFIPVDKVKEVEEKKYRPYKDHHEFITETQLTVGDLITIHDKTIDHNYYTIITSLDSRGIVIGGFILSSFETLLKDYEWLGKDGKWQPFGVEE